METTSLRLFLQSLCQNSPWNYAVFWKVQHEHHMLLTWEDGYYDVRKRKACMPSVKDDACSKSLNEFLSSICEPSSHKLSFAPAIAEMSTTCYALGEGVVGEVAYEGVPRWFFSDQMENDGFSSTLVSQCADEWLPQFAGGIKTILLIPSMPVGVLQLGSFETIAEDAQLVKYIRDKFAADHDFAENPSSFWLSVEVQHQLSIMVSTLAEILDDSSASIRSIIGEDPRAAYNFTNEDPLSNAHNTSCTVPFPRHIFDRHMPNVQEFETEFKEDTQLTNLTDVVAPANHQLFEQYNSEIMNEIERSLDLHEIGVLSGFNHSARNFGDFADEMIDFYHGGGVPLSLDHVMHQNTGELLDLPRDCELHKELGPSIMDPRIQYIDGSSRPFGVVASSSVYNGDFDHCMEPISRDSDRFLLPVNDEVNLLEAVVSKPSSILEYSSPNACVDASSFKYCRRRFVPDFKGPSPSGRSGMVAENSSPRSCVISAEDSVLTRSSSFTTLYNHKVSASSVDQPQEEIHNFPHHRKKSNLSATKKRRSRPGHNQKKPRPRDRQLIQDRIKELRELVPIGEKCSIDALLDKTIKHMAFLQSITDRADKLGHRVVKEELSKRVRSKPSEVKNGTSWALDLVSEKQICPIIVKDLAIPGQILIEMVCDNYGRFLEIAELIHRLELTILQGVMDKRSDATWAHFVVEATGNFQRLDLFWPLMQILQQNQLFIPNEIQEGLVCNPST